jgi:hypothetical protein
VNGKKMPLAQRKAISQFHLPHAFPGLRTNRRLDKRYESGVQILTISKRFPVGPRDSVAWAPGNRIVNGRTWRAGEVPLTWLERGSLR